MNAIDVKELLTKLRNNTCSESEKRQLLTLLANSANESLFKDILFQEINTFEEETENVEFNRIYNEIVSKIQKSEVSRPGFTQMHQIKRYLKIAAIFIIAFLTGGILMYVHFQNKQQSATSYCEIKAPLGAKSEVSLPDGSKVWINAGSKIRYSNLFNNKNREVSMEGEAYFKVAKNKKLSFNVKALGINVIAVGTEFNVKAYSDEGTVETTLIEGRVTVQDDNKKEKIYLEPNEKAVYVRNTSNIRIEDIRKSFPEIKNLDPSTTLFIAKKIDTEPTVAWKDDRLIIVREEMGSLAIKLERKYNVTIAFATTSLKKIKFTGNLEVETIQQILDVIKLSAPIEYKINNKKIVISEDPSRSEDFIQHYKRTNN